MLGVGSQAIVHEIGFRDNGPSRNEGNEMAAYPSTMKNERNEENEENACIYPNTIRHDESVDKTLNILDEDIHH